MTSGALHLHDSTPVVPVHWRPRRHSCAIVLACSRCAASSATCRSWIQCLSASTVLSVVNSLLYCAARTLREAALAGDLPLRLRGAFAASPRVAPLAAFACSASIFIALTLDGQFVFKLATAVATIGALTVWLMIFLASFRLASRRETAGSLPPLTRWKAVLGASITVAIFVSLQFFELFSSSLQLGLPAVILVGGATLLAKRSKPEWREVAAQDSGLSR
ncbi:hypothetical protein [Achromobacter sp. Marseille-Q4962]|uniref:hypothetical protein n=1 Tax=unclassified Achromobacter TaxID=2626865 RepID=UPI000AB552D8